MLLLPWNIFKSGCLNDDKNALNVMIGISLLEPRLQYHKYYEAAIARGSLSCTKLVLNHFPYYLF